MAVLESDRHGKNSKKKARHPVKGSGQCVQGRTSSELPQLRLPRVIAGKVVI